MNPTERDTIDEMITAGDDEGLIDAAMSLEVEAYPESLEETIEE